MIYFTSDKVLIRDFTEADAEIITREEIAQGWHQTAQKYLSRIKDRNEGLCVSLVAEYKGNAAGYINVYKQSHGGPAAMKGLPAIVDFGVLEKYRRRGIGSLLMDCAEQIAARYADTVWLGVGLHAGYGNAQRMYIKRGYIPDGSGVWYGDCPCEPYAEYVNDDNLNLFLSKKLR